MKTSPDASVMIFGLMIVASASMAKAFGMFLEETPPFKAFATFSLLTEPISKVPIPA